MVRVCVCMSVCSILVCMCVCLCMYVCGVYSMCVLVCDISAHNGICLENNVESRSEKYYNLSRHIIWRLLC